MIRSMSTKRVPRTIAVSMRPPELTPAEQRVLGCLIEKRRTTPDTYPLSLNALRLACNQSTNRDPVLAYDEHTVREAAQRLCKRGLARLASGHTSRAIKYRHLAEEALGLGEAELAVLCVLLLRGPQTPGELKGRTERLARIESLAEVERVVEILIERGYAQRLARRPGLKEDRFGHLLREAEDENAVDAEVAAPRVVVRASTASAQPTVARASRVASPAAATSTATDALAERVGALESEVAELRAELRALRHELGA